MGRITFIEWLTEEVQERGWSFEELGRRAGLSSGTMSKVRNQQIMPSWDFCLGVSRALQMRPETVFRIAGLLPPLPPAVEEEEEVLGILRRLPAATREMVLAMLRGLAREDEIPVGDYDQALPYDLDDDQVRQLLEEFAQVPDEWRPSVIDQARMVRRMTGVQPRFIGEEDVDAVEGEREKEGA